MEKEINNKTIMIILGIALILSILINFYLVTLKPQEQILQIQKESPLEKPEILSLNITPEQINLISDAQWLARLKSEDMLYITGTEVVCLNLCGNSCIWLGHTYASHGVYPDSVPWGNKTIPVCSCNCYVRKM